jgi:hypothetical protein
MEDSLIYMTQYTSGMNEVDIAACRCRDELNVLSLEAWLE